MIRHQNLKFLNHLNSIDLLNKLISNNFYTIPKINKISLKIFLKGILNSNFLNLYLKNFLLLYFYCFNNIFTHIKFPKFKNKKIKISKINIILYYSFMKKKIYLSIFNFFFFFKKFIRPFSFSIYPLNYSFSSGKFLFFLFKIIIFIPSFVLLDYKEHRFFPTFKKSKIFLTLTFQYFISSPFYNFFINSKKITSKFLKNFLLVWLFNS